MLTSFTASIMSKRMKRSTLRMVKHYQLKRAVTLRKTEKVSSGKVKYDSLTSKSIIDPTINRFGPYMNKILGISNGNYIDTPLSKKLFSFKINKLSTTDNILNGKPCDVLYTGYLNKDIIWRYRLL